ncbi:choline/ethanolamine transporter flvcr2b-like [Periplaneta americana]|uniref:choline/ethanolamine transporter flvcr2b-like n=1 Tax=Periplaneta americana TaxID=6978 RepID=UPI0037E874B6
MAQNTDYVEVPKQALDSNSKEKSETNIFHGKLEYKVYKRRWVILLIYVCFAFVNNIQWIQYAIINNVVMRYYNVDSVAVDWTAIIFLATFVPLIFPALYFLEKMGLRWAIFLGALGTALGSWIKALSVAPGRFWVTFVGQTFVAMSQVFMLSIPPRLAAVWFGSDQVSTACSIGVFGNQVGVAAGFLMPPFFVKNHDNVDDIGSDLSVLFNVTAGVCTLALILVVAGFQKAPPLPPSPEQALKIQAASEEESFLLGVKRLMINKGFVLLLITYSLDVSVLNSLSTLLNQLILIYFPKGEEFAGQVGFVFMVAGMVGSVIFGIILDKTRKYKETTVAVYVMSTLGMLSFTFALRTESKALVYVTSGFVGCFVGGYMPVGFELGSEITYPESEGTTAGLIILVTQLMGIFHAVLYSWMVREVGDMWSNLFMTATLLLGTALTAMIPGDLRRQAANKVKVEEDA